MRHLQLIMLILAFLSLYSCNDEEEGLDKRLVYHSASDNFANWSSSVADGENDPGNYIFRKSSNTLSIDIREIKSEEAIAYWVRRFEVSEEQKELDWDQVSVSVEIGNSNAEYISDTAVGPSIILDCLADSPNGPTSTFLYSSLSFDTLRGEYSFERVNYVFDISDKNNCQVLGIGLAAGPGSSGSVLYRNLEVRLE